MGKAAASNISCNRRTRGVVLPCRLAEHRLLLANQHIPDDRTVADTTGRGEAEQGTSAHRRHELGLTPEGIAKEQHVRVVGHCEEDWERACQLLRADRDHHQVVPVARNGFAQRRHRDLRAASRLGIFQYQPVGLEVRKATTSSQKDHLVTCLQQLARVDAPDHTGTDDEDSH